MSRLSCDQSTLGRKKARVFRFSLALLVVFATGCVEEVRVRTAHDPAARFADYKSFAMLLPNKALPSKNPLVDPFVLQRLRQLTYLKLKASGLAVLPKDQADLLVAVIAQRSERVDVYPSTSYGFGYGPAYGYGYGPAYGYGPGFGASSWSSQVIKTDEAVVAVDLIDRKKAAVVWRGTGIRSVEPDFDDEKLNQIISAILLESPLHQVEVP